MIGPFAFTSGFLVGVLAALIFLLVTINRARPQASDDTVSLDAAKLIQARKRFGHIANRTSIHEARKIANKALKELQ